MRAAGVAILAALVDSAPAVVVGMLRRLTDLAEDHWWQVQAGLVQTATGVLRYLRRLLRSGGGDAGRDGKTDDASPSQQPSKGAQDAADNAVALIQTVMRAEPSSAVQRMFVSLIGPLLASYPELASTFVEAVVALPPDARERLLSINRQGRPVQPTYDVLPLRGPSGHVYELEPVGRQLPYETVLSAVTSQVRDKGLQHLEIGHFQLALACVHSATAAASSSRDSNESKDGGDSPSPAAQLPACFSQMISSLQDHVFVGLCDADCCAAALELLRHCVLRLPDGVSILSAPTLQGSLLLLHQPPTGVPDETSKGATASFLADIARRGPSAARVVADLISAWGGRYPALYASSPLKSVRDGIKV